MENGRMSGLPGLAGKLKEIWTSNHVTFINLVVTLGTFGLEQAFSTIVFRCPCQDAKTKTQGNFAYGLLFLIIPAVLLLAIGCAINPTSWKLCTGFCRRSKKKWAQRSWVAFKIFLRSLLAPTVWICIALLEGKYFACAFTAAPYNETCRQAYDRRNGEERFSVKYHDNIARSQFIGWIVIACSFVFAIALYTWAKCCSPLVHWQRKYLSWTKEIEREQFAEVAKQKITQEARKNIMNFIEQGRRKEDWESVTEFYHISDVQTNEKISAYSALQEWAKSHPAPAGANNARGTASTNGPVGASAAAPAGGTNAPETTPTNASVEPSAAAPTAGANASGTAATNGHVGPSAEAEEGRTAESAM